MTAKRSYSYRMSGPGCLKSVSCETRSASHFTVKDSPCLPSRPLSCKRSCMEPYLDSQGNGSQHPLCEPMSYRNFYVQSAEKCETMSIVPQYYLGTLNWKLNTGGSFLILSRFVASCDTKIKWKSETTRSLHVNSCCIEYSYTLLDLASLDVYI